MSLTELAGLTATTLGIMALSGRGLRSLLRAFHHEHVAPSLAQVTAAIAHNTEATATLTTALAKSNEAQERGFNRLGDIIADHETRITVLEQPPRPVKAARIRRSA
jgi:hypothetical protein